MDIASTVLVEATIVGWLHEVEPRQMRTPRVGGIVILGDDTLAGVGVEISVGGRPATRCVLPVCGEAD